MGDFSKGLGNFVSGTISFTKKVAKGVKKVNDSINADLKKKEQKKLAELRVEFEKLCREFYASREEMGKDEDLLDIDHLTDLSDNIIGVGEHLLKYEENNPYVLFNLALAYEFSAYKRQVKDRDYLYEEALEYINKCISLEEIPDSASYSLKYELCKKLKLFSEAQDALQIAEGIEKAKKSGNLKRPEDFEGDVETKKLKSTKNGLKVQSEGESKIADFLFEQKIDFDYDKQITLEGKEKNREGYKSKWIRPDFYLTEFDIIIEYWGLKGTEDYDSKMEEKKRLYKEAGKRFISIMPEDLPDLDNTLKIKLERLGCKL